MRHGAPLTLLPLPAMVAVLLAAGLGQGARLAVAQTWRDQVGYALLKSRVGAALPTGAGGAVSQVEASLNGAYYIDAALVHYDGSADPRGQAVQFTDGSGGAEKGISSHTSVVASRFYGDVDSLAPGANNVVLYEANHWLTSVLQAAGTGYPVAQNYRVQNHSWVGTMATGSPSPPPYTEHPLNIAALQRYDYLIETANNGVGLTAAVGLNNGTNPIPFLLSQSYNAIAVGRTDGQHSTGFTLGPDITPPDDVYGPGRSKPDLVAPHSSTSAATGAISGAAALLHEAVAGAGTAHNEVIKSLLLAGATKEEFPNWSRTPTQPLDDTFGAGELNIYNSYLMTRSGRQPGSRTAPTKAVGAYGWDYQDFKQDSSVGDLFYSFEVPAGSTADELSIALSWNAKVTDLTPGGTLFSPSLSLQNLDLQFYDSTTGFLRTLLDQSVSDVDNVEHLYLTDLGPGKYTLRVSGAAGWDYGLAWRTKTRFTAPSADFNGNGVVDGGDLLVWQRNNNTLLGAIRSRGDADGDGDVDGDDLFVWETAALTRPRVSADGSATATPEPAAWLLAASGLAPLLSWRRRRV